MDIGSISKGTFQDQYKKLMVYASAYQNKWHQVEERLIEKQVNAEKKWM